MSENQATRIVQSGVMRVASVFTFTLYFALSFLLIYPIARNPHTVFHSNIVGVVAGIFVALVLTIVTAIAGVLYRERITE